MGEIKREGEERERMRERRERDEKERDGEEEGKKDKIGCGDRPDRVVCSAQLYTQLNYKF